MTTTEPIPTPNGEIDKEIDFFKYIQAIIDCRVRESVIPLAEMSDEQLKVFVMRMRAVMKFELECSRLDQGRPLQVTGRGMVVAVDKEGHYSGSQLIADGDVVVGFLSSAFVDVMPTIGHAFQMQNDPDADWSKDRALTVMPILKDATMYLDPNARGEFQVEKNMGAIEVGAVMAHPLHLSPIRTGETAFSQ